MSEAQPTNDTFIEENDCVDRDVLQLVSFEIGVEEYAIPSLAVQEINRLMPITRVPHSPAAGEGVIKPATVVDLPFVDRSA